LKPRSKERGKRGHFVLPVGGKGGGRNRNEGGKSLKGKKLAASAGKDRKAGEVLKMVEFACNVTKKKKFRFSWDERGGGTVRVKKKRGPQGKGRRKRGGFWSRKTVIKKCQGQKKKGKGIKGTL